MTPLRLAAIVLVSFLVVVLAPRFASAEAGSGGGGGGVGCQNFPYSTCVGAVWRYYKSNSNSYPIKNVLSGYTYVTGCAASGGFFAYVLVNKNAPSDPNQVRSWKIGPVEGDYGARSEFFGGYTRYRLYSNPSDPAPTNPGAGDYSWYSAEKAFAITTARGQSNGYQWNSYSTLGWFCYQGQDYTLTPSITGTPNSSEGGGSAVTVSPSVNNSGSTVSATVQWQLTGFTVAPGAAVPGGGNNNRSPQVHYGNGATRLDGGSGSFNRGVTAVGAGPRVIGDYAVGTRVCYALSVQPYNQNTSDWRHSAPFCVVIAKKPKVQVLGSDLIVGKLATSPVITSTSSKVVNGTARLFGSWGEYGVIASGAVTGFASGSGYSGGSTSSSFCEVSLLTVTNAGTSVCSTITPKGNYKVDKALPDISARLVTTTDLGNNPTINVSALTKGAYSASGGVSITSGGDIAKGKWVVINAPTATVNITNNITYTNAALQGISDIPQVVIIANQITIEASVTRVDAWLVATGATGSLNTCREITAAATQLNSTRCNAQLVVNGPVIAKRLYLNRTYGAGTGLDTGTPAEVFNLRPDAALWATSYTASAGRLQTVSTKELPPRF